MNYHVGLLRPEWIAGKSYYIFEPLSEKFIGYIITWLVIRLFHMVVIIWYCLSN
nr:MAG TPA: hypothetical protein [Caudoviricetes sp.]